MAAYRHRHQHRRHSVRYGLAHWRQHRADVAHTHEPRRRRRRRASRVRVALLAVVLVLVVLGLAAVAALASYHSLERARASLEAAKSQVASLQSSSHQLLTTTGRARAADQLAVAASEVASARSQVTGSLALRVAGSLPVLSTQRAGLLQLIDDVSDTVAIGRQLLFQADELIDSSTGTSIDLPALARLRASVGSADARLRTYDRPAGSLWGSLGSARRQFDQVDAKVVGDFDRADQILGYADVFLGGQGPRTYLLATENNAEMRDQGAILSVAELSAAGGHLTSSDPASVQDLPVSSSVDYPLPPGMEQIFGSFEPTRLWQSANASADFPWSGGDLQALYAATTGRRVDGVVAMDVVTLASLLKLSGPVRVPGITEPITAADVAPVLLHDLYQGYPPSKSGQDARHDELSVVARAVVTDLGHRHIDLAALAEALSADVAGRHLMVWDSVPAYESTLRAFGADGGIDDTNPGGTFHVAVENATATKLDYYVTAAVAQQIDVTRLGDVVVQTTVTVANHAPRGQPPSLQLGPDGISSFTPGQYVGHVFLWSPRGAVVPGSVTESGLTLSQANISVLPGQRTSVLFHTELPHALHHGVLTLTWIPQPRLRPETVAADLQAQGWRILSSPAAGAVLTRTRTLTWRLLPA